METGVGVHNARMFADMQIERGLLERLLHATAAKRSQVATSFCRTAIGELLGQFLECSLTRIDL